MEQVGAFIRDLRVMIELAFHHFHQDEEYLLAELCHSCVWICSLLHCIVQIRSQALDTHYCQYFEGNILLQQARLGVKHFTALFLKQRKRSSLSVSRKSEYQIVVNFKFRLGIAEYCQDCSSHFFFNFEKVVVGNIEVYRDLASWHLKSIVKIAEQ